MNLEVGQLLSGTLRAVRKIAEGGMGSVWIAEHVELGTRVAVKILSRPWAAMPGAAARLLREARLTAAIDSPHVVRILDCRRDEADEPYLVLELLEGENLEQRVRRSGVLSVTELRDLVAQTCEALSASHAAGVVHRDLKPDNVFLVAGRSVYVKVLDFGVAKPTDRGSCIDADRLPAGTPQYMSPEHVFDPESTDARSDLFSLGAVAYFALTGRSPFDCSSLEGLCVAMETGAFDPPSRARPELPISIDRWFAQALAREPSARFPSARAMAEALDAALRAREPAAPSSTPAPRRDEPVAFALPARRVRWRAVAAVAIAVACGALLLLRHVPGLWAAEPAATATDAGAAEGSLVVPAVQTRVVAAPR